MRSLKNNSLNIKGILSNLNNINHIKKINNIIKSYDSLKIIIYY